MLKGSVMSPRKLLPLCPALALALAACSGNGGTSDGQSNNPPVAIDQSSMPRKDASAIPASALQGAVTANNAFALDLYGRLRTDPTLAGNLLTSPISASLALTMTYGAAQGTTATQMASALHMGSSASSIFDGQNALSQALASRAAAALAGDTKTAQENQQPAPSADDYQLQIVNSVWGQQTYPWAMPFLDILAQSYGTGVYLEDFVHDFDPARITINDWVSTETAGKITNLLPEGSLDTTTRMVLVNAIHLKLPWAYPFQTSATANATFTKSDGSTVSTSFMNQAQQFFYADDGNAQIVSLPLSGGDLSVVVALPHGDLATYEAGLTAASLQTPTQYVDVQLSLPKVSFTSPTFSLAKELQAMGMTQAFDRTAADFKGACPNPPDGDNLYISDVLQKAMIAMQEQGVEAAAATAVVLSGASVAPQTTPMNVNRPFVFAIEDVTSGAILFLGHVEDPTQGS
jgi:serpin B